MWDTIRDDEQFLQAGFDHRRYCPAGHFPQGTKSAVTQVIVSLRCIYMPIEYARFKIMETETKTKNNSIMFTPDVIYAKQCNAIIYYAFLLSLADCYNKCLECFIIASSVDCVVSVASDNRNRIWKVRYAKHINNYKVSQQKCIHHLGPIGLTLGFRATSLFSGNAISLLHGSNDSYNTSHPQICKKHDSYPNL